MDERRGPGSLEERVGRLEVENENIRGELRGLLRRANHQLGGLRDDPPAEPMQSVRPEPSTPAEKDLELAPLQSTHGESTVTRPISRRSIDIAGLWSGGWWLNKVGIGLLLSGLALLFMLAVERGWIGASVRVSFGVGLGGTLLALGLLLQRRRWAYSQVLLGGSLAALYTSGFAAFQLYSIFSYPVALAFMIGITVLAFGLALRYDGVTMCLIGALGALGTPFLLYTDSGTLGGLVIYTCLVLCGAMAAYLYRGWTSLLIVTFLGGWAVLSIGYVTSFLPFETQPPERLILQLGVTNAWMLFTFVPAAREIMRARMSPLAGPAAALRNTLLVLSALFALGFAGTIWQLRAEELGWISLAGAVLYVIAAFVLYRRGRVRFAYVLAQVSLLLLTLAFALVLRADTLLLTLTAEAVALHFLARRFSDRIVSLQAHSLSVVAATWLSVRLMGGIVFSAHAAEGPALTYAAVDLAVIASGFVSSVLAWPRLLRVAYRIAAHAALLALIWRELDELPDGDAWITVAWGLYAVALLAAGFRSTRPTLARDGMATLFVVAGKLFLVDLSEVDPVLRAAHFLGFGGLFLAVSYFLQALWNPDAQDGNADVASDAAGERR